MIYLLALPFGIIGLAALWLFPMDRGEWSAKDQRAYERETAKAAHQ